MGRLSVLGSLGRRLGRRERFGRTNLGNHFERFGPFADCFGTVSRKMSRKIILTKPSGKILWFQIVGGLCLVAIPT